MKLQANTWKRLAWLGVLLLSIPFLRAARTVRPAAPLPAHWHLPRELGAWKGERIYYSTDPDVRRAFLEDDIAAAGVCPVSGAPLSTISQAERGLLPHGVEIDRRLYEGPADLRRQVILLITGESREGIHRPEWCLAAQDIRVGERYFLKVPDPDGGRFAVGVYPLLARGAPARRRPQDYFVYWFEGPGVKTGYAFLRILRMGWDRLRTGRAQRWAYFSIQMSMPSHVADPDAYIRDAVQWLVANR